MTVHTTLLMVKAPGKSGLLLKRTRKVPGAALFSCSCACAVSISPWNHLPQSPSRERGREMYNNRIALLAREMVQYTKMEDEILILANNAHLVDDTESLVTAL